MIRIKTSIKCQKTESEKNKVYLHSEQPNKKTIALNAFIIARVDILLSNNAGDNADDDDDDSGGSGCLNMASCLRDNDFGDSEGENLLSLATAKTKEIKS